MTFTITTLARSIADHLAGLFPGVTFYEDPNQQGTSCPAAFVQLMSSEVKVRRQKWLLRTLRIDLTYLEDYNQPDLQRRYQEAAEVLDLNMELFEYSDGNSKTILRTYNRQAAIDLDGLHYKFDLQVWLSPEEDAVLMRELKLLLEVRYYGKEEGVGY